MTAHFLARFGGPVLLAAALAAACFAALASRVGIERDNESLRSTDPRSLATLDAFHAAFGNDEEVLVALGHEQLLAPRGLALLDDLARRAAAIDGVRRVWSLANVEELAAGEAGAEPRPLLSAPWDAPGAADAAAKAIARNGELEGWLVSRDRRAAGLVVELDDRPGDADFRSRVVAGLRALAPVAAAGGGQLHVTGVPVQKIDVSTAVERDQGLLLPAAVGVLGVVLALFFRHAAGVVVPLACAGLTVATTVGFYGLAGFSTNAITALLPPVLLVVALASAVHVVDAWVEGQGSGGGEGGAGRAARAARQVWVPTMLCAVTTAQGFASLAIGGLPAVRQFGVFAAVGTVVALVASAVVAPAMLARLPVPASRRGDGHGWTLALVDATSGVAARRPRTVLAGFAAVTLVLGAGIPALRSNTDLVAFLRGDTALGRDTAWVDAHLAGSLPFEFLVRRKGGGEALDLASMKALVQLEVAALRQPHVEAVASVLPILRQLHRVEGGAASGDASGAGARDASTRKDEDALRADERTLPGDERTLRKELDLLDESGHALVRRFVAPGLAALRVTVRLRAVGSADSLPVVEAIAADARRLLGQDFEVEPTGALWEVVRDSEGLVDQQLRSFGAAIVLVVAAIGLLLRSWVMTMVAMVPNVMPILWTGGLMGWLGVDLSTGTAMIASAVLGLVVDDTIHYLSHYRHAPEADAAGAVRRTSRTVGAPVTVASTSLVLGFWVGALGSFEPTVWFSLLTGLAMITGVLCDLLVLPACLVLLDHRIPRPRAAKAP